MHFDRFDICAAWYIFLSEYHEGQGSDKYKRLCKLLTYYTPAPSLRWSNLNDNERSIYDNLVRKEEERAKRRNQKEMPVS